MSTRSRTRSRSWGRALAALAFAAGLGACGGESPAAKMAGTYATNAVQAELEERERDFFGDDLHGRFDAVDRAAAEENDEPWARLRLRGDGSFEYEGPVADGGAQDRKLRGRWTARTGYVDLDLGTSGEAEGLAPKLALPASASFVELPFVTDPASRRPLRLDRR